MINFLDKSLARKQHKADPLDCWSCRQVQASSSISSKNRSENDGISVKEGTSETAGERTVVGMLETAPEGTPETDCSAILSEEGIIETTDGMIEIDGMGDADGTTDTDGVDDCKLRSWLFSDAVPPTKNVA